MAKKSKVKKNLGKLDRIIRTIIGVGLAYTAYTYVDGMLMWAMYSIAAILLITVFRSRCLPYDWFGINTNK